MRLLYCSRTCATRADNLGSQSGVQPTFGSKLSGVGAASQRNAIDIPGCHVVAPSPQTTANRLKSPTSARASALQTDAISSKWQQIDAIRPSMAALGSRWDATRPTWRRSPPIDHPTPCPSCATPTGVPPGEEIEADRAAGNAPSPSPSKIS
jgi:hypothetical protein